MLNIASHRTIIVIMEDVHSLGIWQKNDDHNFDTENTGWLHCHKKQHTIAIEMAN